MKLNLIMYGTWLTYRMSSSMSSIYFSSYFTHLPFCDDIDYLFVSWKLVWQFLSENFIWCYLEVFGEIRNKKNISQVNGHLGGIKYFSFFSVSSLFFPPPFLLHLLAFLSKAYISRNKKQLKTCNIVVYKLHTKYTNVIQFYDISDKK